VITQHATRPSAHERRTFSSTQCIEQSTYRVSMRNNETSMIATNVRDIPGDDFRSIGFISTKFGCTQLNVKRLACSSSGQSGSPGCFTPSGDWWNSPSFFSQQIV
jgi:hypothetical protein